jgi:hypothetical protein
MQKEAKRKKTQVRICLALYAVLFVYGALLLATPPAKLPLLFCMFIFALASSAIGQKITRYFSIALVILTLWLIIREVADAARLRTIHDRTRKSQVELGR